MTATNAKYSSFDVAVRRVRYLRFSGEPMEEQERIAKWYARTFALNWQRIMSEAQKRGPTDHRRHETR